MLGQLGGGYGSVEVPVQVEDPRIRHISLICYPLLIHEVKMRLPGCRNIAMPKVVKTLKKKWKQIERVYQELSELNESRLCGYHVEARVHGNITIKECKESVRHFMSSPPGFEETMQVTPREYKKNIDLMVQVGSTVMRGRNEGPVTVRQLKALSNTLNALGLWSGKFHRYLNRIVQQPLDW